jgi:two-component system, LuxR family, sensor histidine kinase DctS
MIALGELAAGVAHELNNPLLIVQATLAQLRRKGDEQLEYERVARGLSTIESTANRMTRIVRGLMLFAREETRERFIYVSLKDVVQHSVDLCGERFRHHGVRLQVAEVDASLSVECQPIHLAEVLINLLLNAFSAVHTQPDAWVSLECSATEEQVELIVADSGNGIDAAMRDDIMRPFFTTKPVGQGVGLGLSVAFGIVEAHHGVLLLDDRTPYTRFIVRIPRSQSRRVKSA